ncbi:prepilin-type N-terminal cleavage/methylation domain-containing protein [Lysinibacillus fusiformis]|nr:prepilin-type N-terminal cleavage/methylation domain-containing protein [Lysinibacillus fusiformis]
MFKTMNKRIKNEKGLTLIELLAVIVILAIVAAIAVPAIGNIIENSRYKAVKADAINIINAANLYFTENSHEEDVLVSELQTENFLDSRGKIPANVIIYKSTSDLHAKNKTVIDGTSEEYSNGNTIDFDFATADDINAADDGEETIGTGSGVTPTNP